MSHLRMATGIENHENEGLDDPMRIVQPETISMVERNCFQGEAARPFWAELLCTQQLRNELMSIDTMRTQASVDIVSLRLYHELYVPLGYEAKAARVDVCAMLTRAEVAAESVADVSRTI